MAQQERKVVVAAPSSNAAKVFNTSASTWGELKREISSLMSSNLDAVVPELNNASLSRDEAVLPSGDFRVFLIPTKNKAGAFTSQQAKELGSKIQSAIEEASKKASVNDFNSLRDSLVSTIEDFFEVDLSEARCPECDEALEEARKLM